MRTPTSTSRTVRLTALLAAPLTVGLVLGGCSTAPDARPVPAASAATSTGSTDAGSVGRLTGGSFDGLVGVVSNGTDVVAYVCDGDTGAGERFAGTLDAAGRAELRSEGGAVLALTVAGTGAGGSFIPAGQTTPIAFTTTAATGDAGVYLADGETDGVRWGAGWVVLADGTQEGAARENGEARKVAPVGERSEVRSRGNRTAPTTAPASPTAAPTRPKPVPELSRKIDAVRQAKRVSSRSLTAEEICARVPTRCTT